MNPPNRNFSNLPSLEKLGDFSSLCESVRNCHACSRMENSARILGPSSGPITAKLMFIGEAPGRLGADASGIPFHGDKAGNNFEYLLDFVGIGREDIYVTNAVLCNPKDRTGNNVTPNTGEISRCSKFLRRQIDLIDPAIVVTLGASALAATRLIDSHALILHQQARTKHDWYGRCLIPLYHPGQRAMVHRSLANQRSDYQFVAEQWRRLGFGCRTVRGTSSKQLVDLVKAILYVRREITYFGLHKLAYLLEWNFAQEYAERLTGSYFIRQKDGPYCTDLHLSKLKNAIPGLKIRKKGSSLYLSLGAPDLFEGIPRLFAQGESVSEFLIKKLSDYEGKGDMELKSRAYLTKPMKQIMQLEKNHHLNMYNAPLVFG